MKKKIILSHLQREIPQSFLASTIHCCSPPVADGDEICTLTTNTHAGKEKSHKKRKNNSTPKVMTEIHSMK